jgi:hypothetical protein
MLGPPYFPGTVISQLYCSLKPSESMTVWDMQDGEGCDVVITRNPESTVELFAVLHR